MDSLKSLSELSREELETRYVKLTSIIEGANLATWEWNIQTDNLEVNEQWARTIGYSLEELEPISNDTWVDSLHPEDLIKSDNLIQKHLNGENDNYECDVRIRHKDGRWIWIKHKGKVMKRDTNGDPVKMFGTHTDITIEYEQAIELERIFSINLDLLSILDTNGRFVKVNEAWSKLLGIPIEELEGQKALQYIYKDDISKSLKSMKKLKNGEEVRCFINRLNTPDGEYRYLEWKIRPYEGQVYAVARDVTDRMEYEERILDVSNRDPLTNVYNRRYVFKRGEEMLKECKDTTRQFSLSIFDIDKFKNINDTYGHQMGDFILKEFTKIIGKNLRENDILGRYGGEEFILILNGVDKCQSNLIIERILDTVREKKFTFNGEQTGITFSGGIADSKEIDEKEATLDKLVKLADKRMYEAKNTGRNKIVFNTK